MDQYGSLELSWSAGYTGTTVHVIDDCTICFVNGNTIKFTNLETQVSSYLLSPGDGVGELAINASYRCIAFSDNGLRSKIYIYKVGQLSKPENVLKGDTKLGYTAIAFANNGSILASCSNMPDIKLTIWNWRETQALCTMDVTSALPYAQLTFNPVNWRQLCASNELTLATWNIEQINDKNILTEKKCVLPLTNGELAVNIYEDEEARRSSVSGVLRLTKSSIAGIPPIEEEGGLSKEKLQYFDPGNEAKACMPAYHCWAPEGQVICGCVGGQLLVADSETSQVAVLHLPRETEDAEDPLQTLQEGCFNSIVLHKNGLFTGGKDGILRCLKVDNDEVSVVYCQPVGDEIKSLQFSPNYQKIAVGSAKGSILIHDIWKSLTEILNDGREKIVGLACLSGGNQYCVTCREDGLVQTWAINNGDLCGQLLLKRKVCSLVCPTTLSACIVGSEDGALLVVDCTNVDTLRCVQQVYVHKGPVSCMRLDSTGRLLFTGSSDNNLFIIDTLLTSNMNVIGYTMISGDVLSISCVSLGASEGWKLVAGVSTSPETGTCNHLVEMTLDQDIINCPSSAYLDSTRLLKDASIKKRTYLLKNSVHDVVIANKETAFGISNNKRIAKFMLSDLGGMPEGSTNRMMDASSLSIGHSLPGGMLLLSSHQQWLLSSAPDGYVLVRDLDNMEKILKVHAGNYRIGGLTSCCFTGDAQYVLSSSADGSFTCWNWNFTSVGKSRAGRAVEAFRDVSSSMGRLKQEQDKFIVSMPTIDIEEEVVIQTRLDTSVAQARLEEDKKYTAEKSSIRHDFQSLREKILKMMADNETVPEMEKLDRQEFVLDVDEIHTLQHDREENLKQLSDRSDLDNISKQFIQHAIKLECWDEMDTKGQSITTFNLPIIVVNYPMKAKTEEEIKELEFVTNQRQLEMIELKTRASIMKSELSVYPDLVEAPQPREGEEEVPTEEGGTPRENPATYGSLGFAYGGKNEYLYNQFSMHNSQQKRQQIVLLKDCIFNIKTEFNKAFDEVFKAKEIEIKRINERNARIAKIMKDLDLTDKSLLTSFKYTKIEDTFEVDDSEVTVEKYISPEEQAKLDELDRLEQERLAAEKADNIRGRALEQMMAGRLETNTEEELKKDIVPPEFMLVKPQADWTEEEQKESKDYEKRQQERKEEREKYHKSLETELKKLQTQNTDGTTSFDEKLQQLFQKKIKTEMVINQEELKVLRYVASVMIDEELDVRENELLAYLEEKKVEKQQSSIAKGDAKRDVEAFRDEYELLLADDRMLDKMFRREFNDIDTHTIDTLYRLFKRRPRGPKALKAAQEQQDAPTSTEGDPFSARPASSRAASAANQQMREAMEELDGEAHMPDNVSSEVWQRFVQLRQHKVEKEQQVKAKALVLAEMNAYLQHQIDRDEALNLEVENTFHDIQGLRDERLKFNLNLEVQLVLKQGQVEVPMLDFVPDYQDSILIHRSAVEDLNATINVLGAAKLASMRESKEFRKGIHQLEWELRKMFMKAEDFQTAARDLQLLRVTKELQAYLGEENHQSSKQQEIQTLEKTLEVYKNMQKRKISDRQRQMKKLTKQIAEKEAENSGYDDELEEMSISVVERGKIDEVNADQSSESGSAKRMQDIITRRKLVDLAKAQAQEIAVLRAEVERLRMRTFPALTQMEGPQH